MLLPFFYILFTSPYLVMLIIYFLVIDRYITGKANLKEVISLPREKDNGLAKDVAIVETDMDLINKEVNEEAAQDYLRIML